MIDSANLLQLHRDLIEIPSLSHEEAEIADFVQAWLENTGAKVIRLGDNVIASGSNQPKILFNSHLDTVPPTEAWTRDPFTATTEEGKVFGLGSNDTKGSVSAMMSAFAALLSDGCRDVAIILAPEEETGGKGTEIAWPHARDELQWNPQAILVGEPTSMQIGASQSGMLVLEIIASGTAAHAAHATDNPVLTLAKDIVSLQGFGGQTTVLTGSKARNQVPASATAVVDFRTHPGICHTELIDFLQAQIQARVSVRSERLKPFQCPPESHLIQQIQTVRPESKPFHSRTMSDLVFFQGFPAVKIGPGDTLRSHTADEFIYEHEVIEGANAYFEIAKEVCK